MAELFNFCNKSLVPVTLPPEPVKGVTMNGWAFSSRPTVPYQKRFRITLYGLRWYLSNSTGLYDSTTNADYNARALELFYERHGLWKPFQWTHPHLGMLNVKFNAPVTVPESLVNSGGLIEKMELEMVHDNPGYV